MKTTIFFGARFAMTPLGKMVFLFLFGGVGYGLIELLWRGRTHPSMVLTGGACFVIIWGINSLWRGRPLLLRCAACAFFITAVEFGIGMLVNRLLHMSVWDYSGERFHLLGQICPKYTFLWFMLSLPLSMIVSRMTGVGADSISVRKIRTK